MRAGVRRAGVQARRDAVDHVVAVSSRRYPHGDTTHHETMRWFAERYNTVATQPTVPNKSGVWRGCCCCCCIVEVALWRHDGGGDDDDAIAYKRAPEPRRCRNTHNITCTTHTHARTQSRTRARRQARTHTSTHAYTLFYSEPLHAAFGTAGGRGVHNPALPTTTHATPMPRACSTSVGASVYTPALAAHWLYPSAPWQINTLCGTPLPPCGPCSTRSGSIGSSSLSCDSGTHRSRRGTTW